MKFCKHVYSFEVCMQLRSKFARNDREAVAGQAGNRDSQNGMTQFCVNNSNLFTTCLRACVWRLGVYTKEQASNPPPQGWLSILGWYMMHDCLRKSSEPSKVTRFSRNSRDRKTAYGWNEDYWTAVMVPAYPSDNLYMRQRDNTETGKGHAQDRNSSHTIILNYIKN